MRSGGTTCLTRRYKTALERAWLYVAFGVNSTSQTPRIGMAELCIDVDITDGSSRLATSLKLCLIFETGPCRLI
jgi:hypothetical protein